MNERCGGHAQFWTFDKVPQSILSAVLKWSSGKADVGEAGHADIFCNLQNIAKKCELVSCQGEPDGTSGISLHILLTCNICKCVVCSVQFLLQVRQLCQPMETVHSLCDHTHMRWLNLRQRKS